AGRCRARRVRARRPRGRGAGRGSGRACPPARPRHSRRSPYPPSRGIPPGWWLRRGGRRSSRRGGPGGRDGGLAAVPLAWIRGRPCAPASAAGFRALAPAHRAWIEIAQVALGELELVELAGDHGADVAPDAHEAQADGAGLRVEGGDPRGGSAGEGARVVELGLPRLEVRRIDA